MTRPRTAAAPVRSSDLDELREQLANLSKDLTPVKAGVERLAAPREAISVPEDIAKALRAAHSRLDKVDTELAQIQKQLQRMSTTFSNALISLAEKVEKISGGEDSTFSLAHSLEELIRILSNRKFNIKRDRDGNMVSFETDS